jgi:DtxR family Mn-dependent transcriptional regulator
MSLNMARVGEISESLEDYLKIIYQLEMERRVARVKDIAARKGVRMASVTGALRRMSKEGLVRYGAREFVELTEAGSELARKVLQRNDFLRRFLTLALGLDEETAEHDADAIEHHLSPETLARFAAFFQFMDTFGHARLLTQFLEDGATVPCQECPHADKEKIDPKELRSLSSMEPGRLSRVAWVMGDAAQRLELVEKGVLPRVRVTVESRHNGTLRVRIKGTLVNLTEEQARAVQVRPADDEQL